MKFLYLVLALPIFSMAQSPENMLLYEANEKFPFGRLNPNAPIEVREYESLIGICDCKFLLRNPDQSWSDTTRMIWKWKYIMNGQAIQDEAWRENNFMAGSIRQYHIDSAQWVVTYYSLPSVAWESPIWHGGQDTNGDIVLYKPQNVQGAEGFYKITFFDISESGFNWKGEWVNVDESIVFPLRKIFCTKRGG
jgi:hypothetical protein